MLFECTMIIIKWKEVLFAPSSSSHSEPFGNYCEGTLQNLKADHDMLSFNLLFAFARNFGGKKLHSNRNDDATIFAALHIVTNSIQVTALLFISWEMKQIHVHLLKLMVNNNSNTFTDETMCLESNTVHIKWWDSLYSSLWYLFMWSVWYPVPNVKTKQRSRK